MVRADADPALAQFRELELASLVQSERGRLGELPHLAPLIESEDDDAFGFVVLGRHGETPSMTVSGAVPRREFIDGLENARWAKRHRTAMAIIIEYLLSYWTHSAVF
jgi:hypothetical protein